MSGQVIGAREVRVSTEKVDITHLSVQVISGVLLSLIPDQDLESCYVAQVDITEKLISKYQVIDIRNLAVDHFFLFCKLFKDSQKKKS